MKFKGMALFDSASGLLSLIGNTVVFALGVTAALAVGGAFGGGLLGIGISAVGVGIVGFSMYQFMQENWGKFSGGIKKFVAGLNERSPKTKQHQKTRENHPSYTISENADEALKRATADRMVAEALKQTVKAPNVPKLSLFSRLKNALFTKKEPDPLKSVADYHQIARENNRTANYKKQESALKRKLFNFSKKVKEEKPKTEKTTQVADSGQKYALKKQPIPLDKFINTHG